jgi:hypothetical protein
VRSQGEERSGKWQALLDFRSDPRNNMRPVRLAARNDEQAPGTNIN